MIKVKHTSDNSAYNLIFEGFDGEFDAVPQHYNAKRSELDDDSYVFYDGAVDEESLKKNEEELRLSMVWFDNEDDAVRFLDSHKSSHIVVYVVDKKIMQKVKSCMLSRLSSERQTLVPWYAPAGFNRGKLDTQSIGRGDLHCRCGHAVLSV